MAQDDAEAGDLIRGGLKRSSSYHISARALKKDLSTIMQLWNEESDDDALAEVEALLKVWPGNAHLTILWASLAQLQDDPKHSLA